MENGKDNAYGYRCCSVWGKKDKCNGSRQTVIFSGTHEHKANPIFFIDSEQPGNGIDEIAQHKGADKYDQGQP